MWRMLLPYYLLFLISIILFLKTDIRIYILSRTELARLVMGTIFLVIVLEIHTSMLTCAQMKGHTIHVDKHAYICSNIESTISSIWADFAHKQVEKNFPTLCYC